MANMALARWSRQWMVREAHSESNLSKPTQAVNIKVNTKGKLLELGGKVVAERVLGRMTLWSCTRAVAEWSSWQQPSYPPLCWRDDGHATNYSMPEGGTMSRHVTSLWWVEVGDNLVELHPPLSLSILQLFPRLPPPLPQQRSRVWIHFLPSRVCPSH